MTAVSPWVSISPERVTVNGHPLTVEGEGRGLLSGVYRKFVGDYPKFYKMDTLSKVGFLAAELLLQAGGDSSDEDSHRAVILFGRSGSVCSDRLFQQTIAAPDSFFPSPSLFVYTLPNIVTGEIAIRHHYHGETAFYLLSRRDEQLMRQTVEASLLDPDTRSVLSGWVDCQDEDHFEAYLTLTSKQQNFQIMEEIKLELKKQIIEVLNLEDLKPEDIGDDEPLFGEGLGLDSIDALELIVMIEKNYGIKLKNPADGKEVFRSVSTMAAFVSENRQK